MFLVHTVGFNARRQVAQARSSDAQSGRRPRKAALQKPALVLAAILAGFLLLESLLPLSTAIKIGADEGFELAKATLCINGYHLYTEIWDDQPPFETFLLTQILKRVSTSVLVPRLMTVVFSVVLLTAVFAAARRVHGLGVAAFATAWLIASPGFLELSCTVMQEIHALAPSLAALAVLMVGRSGKTRIPEIVAGVLLAVALQTKLIDMVYLPLAGLILYLRCRKPEVQIPPERARVRNANSRLRPLSNFKEFMASSLVFGASLVMSFVLLGLLLERNYWLEFQQTWASHFTAPVTLEYGSPDEHAFDWSILLKNWDTTLLAVVGVILCVRQWKQAPLGLVPVAWLILTLVVVEHHKPWKQGSWKQGSHLNI